MRILLSALLLTGTAISVSAMEKAGISDRVILSEANPAHLSEFGFFDGDAGRPAAGLIPYTLGTPLFSDYAEKQRFIHLPDNGEIGVEGDDGRLIFPVGTALIKNFGYDDGAGQLKIIETRVLLNRENGWIALPYVWRPDGSDADLRVGGARLPVGFTAPDGRSENISYAVPNKNQCKQCHSSGHEIRPIGPRLGNMVFPDNMAREKLIARIANMPPAIARWARWDDPESGSLHDRATAYLRGNCGHCHNPYGSASNSGLFFDGVDHGAANAGINKRPVAAGRGSGNLDFVIAPGHPEQSILLYRMNSLDPGIAMPELGRSIVHREGDVLLRQWISELPAQQ